MGGVFAGSFWLAVGAMDPILCLILAASAFVGTYALTRLNHGVGGRVAHVLDRRFGMNVEPDIDLFSFRVALERRRILGPSFFINFVLLFYFFGGIYYLATEIHELTELSGLRLLQIMAGAALIGAAWTRSDTSLGRIVVERTNPVLKSLRKPSTRNFFTTISGAFAILLGAFTLYAGFLLTNISGWQLFSPRGLDGARKIFFALVTPDLTILPMVLKAMVETIFIAFMATLIAVPIAFLTSFLVARNLMKANPWALGVYNALRLVFNFTRSVEPVVWAIIFTVWVGVGPFAGMLALMLHSIASLAKLYSEQIESVDRGPIEAIEATGANKIQVIWYAIVPQIILPYLSFTIYRWDINVRMATIIGLVGGGGVGSLLIIYMGQARWEQVGAIVLVIATVVWVMDYLSAKIREAVY